MAEDHQTRNAMALAVKNAAILLPDKEINEKLVDVALSLVKDMNARKTLSENVRKMAEKDTDMRIAAEVLKLIRR